MKAKAPIYSFKCPYCSVVQTGETFEGVQTHMVECLNSRGGLPLREIKQ